MFPILYRFAEGIMVPSLTPGSTLITTVCNATNGCDRRQIGEYNELCKTNYIFCPEVSHFNFTHIPWAKGCHMDIPHSLTSKVKRMNQTHLLNFVSVTQLFKIHEQDGDVMTVHLPSLYPSSFFLISNPRRYAKVHCKHTTCLIVDI